MNKGQAPRNQQNMREKVKRLNWYNLADRTIPLPDDITVESLIKEFEQYYSVLYDMKYKREA